MQHLKIGIIREGKIPPDNRTPLTPRQCRQLMEQFPGIVIYVQSSPTRCYSDDDYRKFDVDVLNDVSHCDLLLGIKEVPEDQLIEGKAYMIFSHTIKKQPYNRKLLAAALQKNITLIDYELLTDDNNVRLIGFGRWAGIVGAHYALLMLGQRKRAYYLRAAKDCVNLQELRDQYHIVKIPPVKIVITGGGRVANGALEMMEHAEIKQISPKEFLSKDDFTQPVFAQLRSEDLYESIDGKPFDKHLFYSNPGLFKSSFYKFLPHSDALINCMYWSPAAPQLFKPEDTEKEIFNRLHTIADVSADIDGSVSITTHYTSIQNPIYGYNRFTHQVTTPYSENAIDVMAVPNLPNELPRDASREFGNIMMENVLPQFVKDEHQPFFERATISRNGKLTEKFSYLQDYADGK